MRGAGENDLEERAAEAIHTAFKGLAAGFDTITHRAADRFTRCDWEGNRQDALERLELYPRRTKETAAGLSTLLGRRRTAQPLWCRIKRAYLTRIEGEPNRELAETFYNSITRLLFSTIGVNPQIEFVSPERLPSMRGADVSIFERHDTGGRTSDLVRGILTGRATIEEAWLTTSPETVATEIERYLDRVVGSTRVESIEMLREPFYRDNAAYLVGRMASCNQMFPLVLALRRTTERVWVDAVLLGDDEVSILFSFTRAHFHVAVDCPRELLIFLKSIMPWKPVAELYTSIGFHRQGKTELYADLQRRLETHDESFRAAPGDRGLVMVVFDLPSYDRVFKVIRDRFARPKTTTRQQVEERYRLVFRRDRVGRLIDAQEFEHLTFDRSRFEDDLLEELCREAGRTVSVEGHRVVIRHLYVERKVTPLNLYLLEAGEEAVARAIVDYGEAIKELAAANIFPGDFLLKNFGVTRHGRVVFYDYDELCLLEDCTFRALPVPRTPEEELDPEPWFRIDPSDVFPEEFGRFLGLEGKRREVFERHHSDLFDPTFWQRLQRRVALGEPMEFYPYRRERRLPRH